MPTKKNYSRYFVILQEEEKGYSLAGDKLPSGYAKFEIKNDKCKISYYVQNLKKELGPYYMILICSKRDVNKLIKLGEMNIDDYGRTEVSFEYGADNIAETGIGVDKIAGAAILKLSDSNIVSVMTGFTSTEAPEGWRNFEMVERKQEEQEIEQEQPEIIEEIQNQVEPEVEVQENVQESNQESLQENDQESVQEINVPQELTENKEQISSVFDDYEETIENTKNEETSKEDQQERKEKPEVKESEQNRNDKCSDEKETPIGAEGEFFRSVTKEFQQENRISDEIKRCKWYKVPVKDKKSLEQISDYNKYTVAYYPMYSYYKYIQKYGYYLLGYKCDLEGKLKYIVYAIPGTKAFEDQPFGGRSGFVTWIPVKDGEESEHSPGYWLMFYDFKSKTIVIPVKA